MKTFRFRRRFQIRISHVWRFDEIFSEKRHRSDRRPTIVRWPRRIVVDKHFHRSFTKIIDSRTLPKTNNFSTNQIQRTTKFSKRRKIHRTNFFRVRRKTNLSSIKGKLLTVEDQLHESYHSLSTVDFDPEQFDEETNEQNFDYPSSSSSSSIPLIDYSSIPSESILILNNNSTGPLENDRNDEFHSNTTINENVPVDEDLTIEIVLETSNNDNLHNPSVYSPSLSNSSTSPISRRRRRSILPSNIIQSRGLRLSDILSIPQKLYSSLKEQTIDKYRATTSMINTECYICLEDFQSLDSIKLLQCQHVFHS